MIVNYKQYDKAGRAYIDVPLVDMAIKFFLAEYGDGKDFIHARLNGFLGSVIRMISEKQPFRQVVLKKKLPMKKLKVVLPDEYKHALVREEMVVAMGQHLEAIYRQKFLSYVAGADDCGCSVNAAVKSFLDKYNIGVEEWSHDTARRYYRNYAGAALEV